MKTTLTLWLDDEVKRKAKVLAQRRRISVSQLFAEVIEAAYRADGTVKEGVIHRKSA
jgi:predicted transcriptional regulator